MDVQPKVGIGEEGKSTSDIAYEIADMVMERISLKIDTDDCHPDHLKVNTKTHFVWPFKFSNLSPQVLKRFNF